MTAKKTKLSKASSIDQDATRAALLARALYDEMPKPRPHPHMSLYIGKPVQRTLKEIALEYDCRPHDILIQAIDLVFARYGRPSVAELSK